MKTYVTQNWNHSTYYQFECTGVSNIHVSKTTPLEDKLYNTIVCSNVPLCRYIHRCTLNQSMCYHILQSLTSGASTSDTIRTCPFYRNLVLQTCVHDDAMSVADNSECVRWQRNALYRMLIFIFGCVFNMIFGHIHVKAICPLPVLIGIHVWVFDQREQNTTRKPIPTIIYLCLT